MYKPFFLALLFLLACQPTQEDTAHNSSIERGLVSDDNMVVSAHPLASEVGKAVLEKGGNAIDAAIAVQFALAVVYPSAGNLGGGGFMVIREKDGKTHTLDFREMAPAAAHRDMYLDEKGEVVDGLSYYGHLAVGVPGTVDGMVRAHEKFGSLPFGELVQPAVELAQNGFVLTEKEAKKLITAQKRIHPYSTEANPYSAKDDWQAGDSLRLPELANTLKMIRDKGRADFYEGTIADKLVEEMKRGKGIITKEDLQNYEAKWRDAVVGDYQNYRVISMGPPSSGGIALLQLLKMLEDYPLRKYGFHSPEAAHLVIEAERRVYADRAEHLGDMDFYPVPIGGLLDDAYLKQRMATFSPDSASKTDAIEAGIPAKESEETTHYSIVDAEGNAVSVTTTLNGSFGSGVVVGGAGFLLNNEMDDFSAKPGVPNAYGLVGAEANAVQAGKRMLSSMTPTIVEKDGDLFMVVGTPGGSTIITSVFQTILNVIEFDMGMQEAVDAPRFHHQWLPEEVFYEENCFDEETMEALRQKGHQLKARGSIGQVDAILRLEDGRLEGGADSRGDDAAR